MPQSNPVWRPDAPSPWEKKKKKRQDEEATPEPSPQSQPSVAPQSRAQQIEKTIGNFTSGYKQATGMYPAPDKVADIISSGATGSPRDFFDMFSSVPLVLGRPGWDEATRLGIAAEMIHQRLLEKSNTNTMTPQQFWGDFVAPGEGRVDLPWKMDVFSWSPFPVIGPSAHAYLEEQKRLHTEWPAPLPIAELLSGITGAKEDKFRQVMRTRFDHPDSLSTTEMVKRYTLGYYFVDALDGDEEAAQHVIDTGYVPPESQGESKSDAVRSWVKNSFPGDDEKIKSEVMGIARLGRDPRTTYADWVARFSDTEWAPQALKDELDSTAASSIANAGMMALGDLTGMAQGMAITSAASEKAQEWSRNATGKDKELLRQLAGATQALETIFKAPVYAEQVAGAVGVSAIQSWRSGLLGSYASSEEPGLWEGIKHGVDRLVENYKAGEGKMAAYQWAEAAGLDTNNEWISAAALAGELVFQGALGRGMDAATKGAARAVLKTDAASEVKSSMGVLPPEQIWARSEKSFVIRHTAENSGILMTPKDASHIAKVNSVDMVREYVDSSDSIIPLGRDLDLATPAMGLWRRYQRLMDPNVSTRTRAMLLPLKQRSLDLAEATDPDSGVYGYAIHHGLDNAKAIDFASEMTDALAGNHPQNYTPMQVAERVDDAVRANYESQSASKWFQRKVGNPDATKLDELLHDQNKDRDWSDTERQSSYLPATDPTNPRPDAAWSNEAVRNILGQDKEIRSRISKNKKDMKTEREQRIPKTELPKPKRVKSTDGKSATVTVEVPDIGPVDRGIAPITALLNKLGFKTVGSHSSLKSDHIGAHPSREMDGYVEFDSTADDSMIQSAAEKNGLVWEADDSARTLVVKNPRNVSGTTSSVSNALQKRWAAFANDLADAKLPPSEKEAKLADEIAKDQAERDRLINNAEGMAKESGPMTDRDLGNHYNWKYDQRAGALVNSGLNAKMTPDEITWERNVSLFEGANLTPWYDLANGLVTKGLWEEVRGKAGLRSFETFNKIVDPATRARKSIALAKLSTIAIIIGADEFMRSALFCVAPAVNRGTISFGDGFKALAGVLSRRLNELGLTNVSKVIENIFHSSPELRENFFTSLMRDRRNPSWIDVGSGHPKVATAIKDEVATFNASVGPTGSQACRDWLRWLVEGEKKFGNNKPEAYKYAHDKFSNQVKSDPYYKEGNPGYDLLHRRQPVYSGGRNILRSLVDDWIDGFHTAAEQRCQNPVTRKHFIDGPTAVKSGDIKISGVLQTYFGTDLNGKLPLATDMSVSHPSRWGRLRVNPSATASLGVKVGAKTTNTIVHPIEAMFELLGGAGVRLKRETFAVFYKDAEKTIKENRPHISDEDLAYEAMRIAYSKTKSVSYMSEHAFIESNLRNVIMFLPAYRQFAQFWGKKAIQNIWMTSIIVNDIINQKEKINEVGSNVLDKTIGQIPGVNGAMKFLPVETSFFDFTDRDGNINLRQILPPLNILGQDALGLASTVSDSAKSLYETISGGYPPNGPIHAPLEAVVWSLMPSSWQQRYADATGGMEGMSRVIDRRTKRTVYNIMRQYESGQTIDADKAQAGTEWTTRAIAAAKFTLPVRSQEIFGTLKVSAKMNNGKAIEIDLDRMNEAQRQYLSAPDDLQRYNVLQMFPEYEPIATAYNLRGNKQLEYLSKHRWLLPFVVTLSEPSDYYSGPVPITSDEFLASRDKIDPKDVANELKGRINQLDRYVLAKKIAPQMQSISTDPLETLAKWDKWNKDKKGENPMPDVPISAIRAAIKLREENTGPSGSKAARAGIVWQLTAGLLDNVDKNGAKTLERLYPDLIDKSPDERRKILKSSITLSDGGHTPGWKNVYAELSNLWNSGESWARELVKSSSRYDEFLAQRHEDADSKRKAQIQIALLSNKSKLAQYENRDQAFKLMRSAGFTGDDKQLSAQLDDMSTYLTAIDKANTRISKMWSAGNMDTSEYQDAILQRDIQVEALRERYPLLKFSAADWMHEIGLDEYKFTQEDFIPYMKRMGMKELSRPFMRRIQAWNDTLVKQGVQFDVMGKLKPGSTGYWSKYFDNWKKAYSSSDPQFRSTLDEMSRADAWYIAIGVANSVRKQLLQYGYKLSSDQGKVTVDYLNQMYEKLRAASPAFASEVDSVFGKRDFIQYMIDPHRESTAGIKNGKAMVKRGVAAMRTTASLVNYAKTLLGTPSKSYGPYSLVDGLSCSAFTSLVMSRFGVKMSPYTGDQDTKGAYVTGGNNRAGDISKLLPGDLVFKVTGRSEFTDDRGFGHVAIYIGNGKIIESNSGPVVSYGDLRTWKTWEGRRYNINQISD